MNSQSENRWVLDRPNSYIGRSVPRPNAKRLLEGRGHFVDDIVLPRMLNVVFVRSPYAHARILSIDTTAAQSYPGITAVVTGAQLAERHEPWVGVLKHLQGIVSPPQYAMAVEKACWQGEGSRSWRKPELRERMRLNQFRYSGRNFRLWPMQRQPSTQIHPLFTTL